MEWKGRGATVHQLSHCRPLAPGRPFVCHPMLTWNPATVSVALPPGMKLSRHGAVEGTPTEIGAYSFTVTATLLASGEYSRSFESAPKSYTLTILP